MLLALDAPDAVAKTVKLLEAAPTQEEQIDYVLALRTIKDGWTPELRRQYFSWWTKDHSKADAKHPDYVLQVVRGRRPALRRRLELRRTSSPTSTTTRSRR